MGPLTVEAKQVHRLLGLAMLVPLLLWAGTGLIFLTKPGYDLAYEKLSPTLYRFDRAIHLENPNNWAQVNILRTILGYHLLVLDDDTWTHLDPFTLKVKPQPTSDEIAALVADAIVGREARYGAVTHSEGFTVFTDTGVVIKLDWDTLSLQQRGADTRLIDSLYRIHYLQWSGSDNVNRLLGFLGLALLSALTLLGLSTYVTGRRRDQA